MAIIRPGRAFHMLFVRPPFFHAVPPSLKKRPALLLVLVSFFLLSLGACSAGPSPSPASPNASLSAEKHLSPTPTSLPAGTVLYQADWSHGLAGWSGQGWKVVQGQLMSNSGGMAAFTIPYRPTISDYAIEVRIQMMRSVSPYGGYYEIVTPPSPGKDGYLAGILDLKPPGPRPFGDHPQSQVFLDPAGDMNAGSGLPQDYEPGSEWHTYRVEVRGNEVRFLDSGTQIGRATSQQTNVLSNGPIELRSTLVILRVSDLRILTL